jgi:hypothetical protein
MSASKLEVDYPLLAALVSTHGRTTLEALAKPPAARKPINLGSASWLAREAESTTGGAGDGLTYLKTFEAFLSLFPENEAARESLWKKISNPAGSSFLDTVGEAAMAVHLRRNGSVVSVEVPFDPSIPGGKDADIVLDIGGTRYWLDVISILPPEPVLDLEPDGSPFPLRSRAELAEEFARRISTKYLAKFSEAVATGPLAKAPVGVLVCLLKYEQAIVPFLPELLTGTEISDQPPEWLWRDHPNLVLGWVHTLRATADGLLAPVPVLKWSHARRESA